MNSLGSKFLEFCAAVFSSLSHSFISYLIFFLNKGELRVNSLALKIKLFNFNFYLFLLFRFFLFSLFILSSIFYGLQSRNLRYLYFTKILSPNYQVHANHLLYSSFEAANSSSPSYASSHVGLLGPTYIPTRIQGCPQKTEEFVTRLLVCWMRHTRVMTSLLLEMTSREDDRSYFCQTIVLIKDCMPLYFSSMHFGDGI